MKKTIGIVVVIVAVAAVGLVFFYKGGSSKSASVDLLNTSTSQTQTLGIFTAVEVAKHNDQNSCYTIISGSVYDLTSYIFKHPGGPGKVLTICGQDGTSAFMGKHGGQSKMEQTLASLKIGALSQ